MPRVDLAAFEPSRTFRHARQTSTARWEGGRFEVVTLGLAQRPEPYRADRVIGNDPLRQFLVAAPGGRWQTLEASYDPRTNEWFNVYGAEDRQPGEWGHWTGRGMNWNTMCAACHNTRLRKNYDEATDSYHTTTVEMSVGCEACHGPLQAHNDWRKAHPNTQEKDPTLQPFSRSANLSLCATCHSRRGDLTGDFRPGDDYFDHQSLVVVDESDTYFPDGQVRDEDYEFAAFLGSRMNKGGVWCKDCHDPHTAKTLLPGNWLCQRCHNGSVTNAPVIDPVAHSFHRVFGYTTNGVPVEVDLMDYKPGRFTETGGECVNCHMPQTVYMQRHWRHDHGFTIPDPLLTKELGIPNACSRCHADKDVDWSLAAVEKWYGAKMERPSRQRARTVAAARQGSLPARDGLLTLLADNDYPYWQAVSATLLERWVGEAPVTAALTRSLVHTNALVREKAVRALGPLVEAGRTDIRAALEGRLADPARAVRVAAGWALRATVDEESLAGREVRHFLDTNADQPTGQMQKGVWALARQQPQRALDHFQKAVQWEPNSAPLRHELAIVLSRLGMGRQALEQIQAACRLEPREAEYRFKLGLAWHELGDAAQTMSALEQAVQLNPRHARAWYNLGLARHTAGQPDAALEALIRAESTEPRDAAIPYARATILAQLGRRDEARLAARRALEVQPGFRDAESLIEALR
jgi:tetratricopeptide (TPR) repeat protein